MEKYHETLESYDPPPEFQTEEYMEARQKEEDRDETVFWKAYHKEMKKINKENDRLDAAANTKTPTTGSGAIAAMMQKQKQ